MMEPFAVAILGAGLGTRFKSKRAKLLHSVGGRRFIEHAVRTARALSPQKIFVIVGHQAEAVIEALSGLSTPSGLSGSSASSVPSAGNRLGFIRQTKPMGTGHALRCGRKDLESAAPLLLVFYGDTPLLRAETLLRFLEFHRRSAATASVMTAVMEDPTGYGRIVRAPGGSVASIVEQKSASPEQRQIREVNTGIYCFETRLLFAELERLAPDKITGEYYLTDVIHLLNRRGKKVAAYRIADPTEVMGVNTRTELAQADALLRARKARELMLAGVTIYQPETVRIDPDVEVGADTVIEPGVSLLGRTRVREDCHIGSFSTLTDTEVADNVTIRQFCVIAESKIASGASIGPFAHLRMGAEVGSEAKIGNFVEVKKSRIGQRSKAQHLTYLGDATVGEDVNVGAGTITCNYDGEKKHQTVIEDNVFIGSGTELVAPIRVGKNAYVGAGSTITEQVPPDALAIARSRQINKPGWVKERKKKAKKEPVEARELREEAMAKQQSGGSKGVKLGRAAPRAKRKQKKSH
ncbi:MAG: UDP-N-acetylglucosamine diphosphorylase/glucosamine-1-phosphate N-acetyltransferase [Acidobacteria bacterium RIFCSPLOWO2_12_FULL_59_11]|nr:MAG: UDP-N-acetylglucosamine diphosphorylase/glucosamine-1-phosphate N-acetyltransferase [Acidobacteria bacterium RIFCSPLOWO2_12_FULL_59_11]